MTFRTAILLSGSGTNFQSLAETAASDPSYPASIELVISNNPDAYGLVRAAEFDIPTLVINHRDFTSRESFDAGVNDALLQARIEFVCLAGFMRILTPTLTDRWQGRMLNIHPSLLPAFRGNRAHEQVLDSSVVFSGCTVHSVVSDLDAGPIVGQAVVPRLADDTLKTLSGRVRRAEHLLYPAAVRSFLAAGAAFPASAVPNDMMINLNTDLHINPLP